MAKTFSFDLDMNKGERSDQIVYGRAGDKESVNITAHLKLDGAIWAPPSGIVNAYFECITQNDKAVRVKATLSGSDVSVSLPTDVYSFFGIVSNAYFRIEAGAVGSPTYIDSSASFSVYIFQSVDSNLQESDYIEDWRELSQTLIDAQAATKAANDSVLSNAWRVDGDTLYCEGATYIDDSRSALVFGNSSKEVPESKIALPVAINNGGTGATTKEQARKNLGLSEDTFSGDYNDLTNKPTLFSGNYNDLTDKPTIPTTPISVANGGTGATTAAQARANLGITENGNAQTAASADKLSTARTIITNLASTTAASFDGTVNVTPGVSGILPVANGGTGNSTGKAASASTADSASSATKLATARSITTNLASTTAASFDGSANVTPGVTGTLPLANGGTGQTTLAGLKSVLGVTKITFGTGDPPSSGDAGSIYVKLS